MIASVIFFSVYKKDDIASESYDRQKEKYKKKRAFHFMQLWVQNSFYSSRVATLWSNSVYV